MADNVTSPVPAATVLATDQVAGVHYPRSKMVFGEDGTVTDVSATNPMPTQAPGIESRLNTINATLGTPMQAGGAVTVAGIATALRQDTGNASLASVVTNTNVFTNLTPGQKTKAASFPVALASDSEWAKDATITASVGSPTDTTWDGANASASAVSVLKFMATGPTAPGSNYIGRVRQDDGSAIVTTPGTAVNAVLFTANLIGYGGVSFNISGTWVGTLTFQSSVDNATWNTAVAFYASGSAVSAPTSNSLFFYNGGQPYFRVLVSAYTSGTINSVAMLRGVGAATAVNSITLGGGTASIGAVTLNTGTALVGGTVPVAVANSTGTGVWSVFRLVSAATTNGTLLKTGTSRLYGGQITNTATTLRYVKLYNKATLATVGTDTPVFTIVLQPGQTLNVSQLAVDFGMYFNLGLSIGTTVNYPDTDTTAVTAGDLILQLLYL